MDHRPHPLRVEDLLAHFEWARSLARRLVADDATADDVVQNTLVATLRRPPAAPGPLRPWLGRVLGNTARRHARGEGRRARRERAAARREALPSAAELTERAEAQRLLAEALLELAEPEREVVLLHYYEGLSSAEIARRAGIPAGTVRWRLKRGLDELRVRLDARFGGERAHWQRALAPLLAERVAAGVGVAATLAGALWMKLAITAVGLAAVSVLLGFALVAAGVLESPFSGAPREPVVFAPLTVARPAAGPELEPAAAEDVDAREAVAAEVARAAPAGPSRVTVRMRFVDDRGVPVAGVRARPSPGDVGPAAISDRGGRAALSYVPYGPRGGTTVAYTAAGFANDSFEVAGRAGETIEVGDVPLHPGGAISGVVVDDGGVPLAGATVEAPGSEVTVAAGGGMRMSRSSDRGAARAVTGDDGAFRLTGVLAGDVRLRARSDDGLHRGESGLVEVRAGQESGGLVLVAARIPERRRIEGVVLDPAGAPVPWVAVQARYETLFGSGSLGVPTGRDGRFRLVVDRDADYELTVSASDDAWNPIAATGVRPGTLDLVLRFRAADAVELLLVDAAGVPIPRAALAVRAAGAERHLQWVGERELAGGVLAFRRPAERFELEVLAPGFAARALGPLEPAALGPAPLRVVLAPLPGITGRVLAAGAPVAGASVVVHELARQRAFRDGMPAWVEPGPCAAATTDADGRFALTVRASGRFVLRAEREGLAPAEHGPFDYEPAAGVAGIDVELSPGGAIEGRVVRADGRASSSLVLASRGDGHPRYARTDPDGMFRFEHLTPGPWQLLRIDGDRGADRGATRSEPGAPFTGIDADCHVVEGGVTVHDLVDARAADAAVLAGRFAITGSSSAGWRALLVPRDDRGPSSAREPVPLAPDGTFRVGIAVPGAATLVIERAADESGPRFLAELDLPAGETRWAGTAALGTLVLGGRADARASLIALWRGPDGLFGVAPVPDGDLAAGESALRLTVPAGTVELVRGAPGSVDDLRAWPVVSRVDVPAGGEARVEL